MVSTELGTAPHDALVFVVFLGRHDGDALVDGNIGIQASGLIDLREMIKGDGGKHARR